MDRILIIMKKNNGHQGIICPFTGAFFHNMQTCLLVYVQQISGERLQDHWSSGYTIYLEKCYNRGVRHFELKRFDVIVTYALSDEIT